ncbi:MAG: archease [Thiohalomonadaceae bacterium]
MSQWETFSHEADIGVRGRGASPAEAFAAAGLALTSVITDPAGVACTERVDIEREAPDLEILFLDFINALIFEMATRKLVFGQCVVRIEDGRLFASAFGEPVAARHDPAVEVKGATFTELKVAQQSDGEWLAQCVVDV